MPELRRHYFLDEYCIIAADRKKRPSDFQGEDGGRRRGRLPILSGKRGDDPAGRCSLH